MTALIPKAVITTYLQALSESLCTMPLANACCYTLINSAMVMCFNYRKDSYFAISYLEPKDIGNIKEIKEEEMSNKLEKEENITGLYKCF